MPNNRARLVITAAALLGGSAGCAGEDLPPLVASGRFIDFHTDADASLLCMDDFLAREERFVAAVAGAVGVGVPTGRIRYVWDAFAASGEPWACERSRDCYRYDESRDSGLIVSRTVVNRHELVHAVEVPALGQAGSKVLGEGLAEHLGSGTSTAGVVAGFPAAFEAMVERGELDYLLAQHFVGSIVARDGAAKYRAFRVALPGDARLPQFVEVFESIYGRSWGEALAAMDEPIYGLNRPLGCGEGEPLAWDAEGSIDRSVVSQCGDGTFFGPGLVDGQPAFEATFVVEVARAGLHDFTIEGAGVEGVLQACASATMSQSLGSHGGQTIRGSLEAGEHVLLLRFPADDGLRGEAKLRLAFVGPPP
ncbi:hypothetical protein [Nannocystis bainbridge]|uniref:Lipoprotein n=1 Tax=Nannocystis bainbridge TaxID=2995303 RepID=A0ABT5DSB7_9BACT|nr:hypothetical protein [Nannocystis bainbridge]MDC0716546.1 hypothetical protein [Nannocystis bainbridge]